MRIVRLAAVGATLSLSACTGVEAYRTASNNEPVCRHLVKLKRNDERPERAAQCATQYHQIDLEGAQYPKHQVRIPKPRDNDYRLEFLEFDDHGREFAENLGRSEAIVASFSPDKQHVVVVYVHGWRHDAHIGDTDVQKFRTMLAYTRSFLDQRCNELRRYCDSSLTGIFIGWRARIFAECAEEGVAANLCAPFALPTFAAAKAASENIAAGPRKFLNRLSDKLRGQSAKRSQFARDKLLITGHSFGANLLARAFKAQIINDLRNRSSGPLRPPAGDLMVLFNPATEARQWTDIQDVAANQAFVSRQKPVLMSITSACTWPPGADVRDRWISCDLPTALAFPVGRIFSNYTAEKDIISIGHYKPTGRDRGTTHEVEINGAPYAPTDYYTSRNHALSQCAIGDGWLTMARRRSKNRKGWDAGYLAPGAPDAGDRIALNVISDRLSKDEKTNRLYGGINVQFRHGFWRNHETAITHANDPYWNVRALDTAIRNHNGFASYPLWCAINQFVLDDVTASNGGGRQEPSSINVSSRASR